MKARKTYDRGHSESPLPPSARSTARSGRPRRGNPDPSPQVEEARPSQRRSSQALGEDLRPRSSQADGPSCGKSSIFRCRALARAPQPIPFFRVLPLSAFRSRRAKKRWTPGASKPTHGVVGSASPSSRVSLRNCERIHTHPQSSHSVATPRVTGTGPCPVEGPLGSVAPWCHMCIASTRPALGRNSRDRPAPGRPRARPVGQNSSGMRELSEGLACFTAGACRAASASQASTTTRALRGCISSDSCS